ncbi:MAG TPA: outer membrane beta-barrel protein [Vicinamibacterales bacterium]|nr:outer membrane beta-barrel protein [Vicinamibacterales bacterium]HPK71457.1 outer membrane beta-barrel protein [Vicinamibacterales bacterium]
MTRLRPEAECGPRRFQGPPGALLHQALGGTIFFRHLEDLPARVQARLASLLREREFVENPRGEARLFPLRPIAAVEPDFQARLDDRRVRLDLQRRFAEFSIAVLPSRRHARARRRRASRNHPAGYTVLVRVRLRASLLLSVLLLAALPEAVLTQSPLYDGWADARWRFGPLAVTPRVELRNLGWDSNVFNEEADPKRDFTATLAAPIDWWLRFGRGRIHGVNTLESVYFGKYVSQRGFNQRHDLTLFFPLNRVQPYAGGTYLSTHDRPDFEINARIRHREAAVTGGAVVRLASRLAVDLGARQTTYRYDEDDDFGAVYSSLFDRRRASYGAQFRYRLTPLTTLTLLADSVHERYRQTRERNHDGFRLLPGVELGRHALVTGRAQVGYRRLNSTSAEMPDFSGLVADAELSYVFGGSLRAALGFSRDILFSYWVDQPFYIQSGFNASLTRQVSGPWDVQARLARYSLDYQQAARAGLGAAAPRVDRYNSWGGGIGYRVGRDIRVGFNLDSVRRDSVVENLDYRGVRGGMAVTYVLR